MDWRRRSDSQIGGLHFRVGFEFGARAFKDDSAGFEDVAVAGDFEGEVGVLFDEENGQALGAVDPDDLLEKGFYQQRGVVRGGVPRRGGRGSDFMEVKSWDRRALESGSALN